MVLRREVVVGHLTMQLCEQEWRWIVTLSQISSGRCDVRHRFGPMSMLAPRRTLGHSPAICFHTYHAMGQNSALLQQNGYRMQKS